MYLLSFVLSFFVFSQTCFAQCPANYELTPVPSGPPACRPVVPSLDFYKNNDSFSQGYPVCGKDRVAIGLDFKPLDVSDSSWPKTALSTSSSNPLAPYPYSSPGPGGVDHPIYLYSIPTARMTRCACTNNSYRPTADGVGNLLPDLPITPANPTGARFFTDDYDTIRSQDRSATGPNYSMVAIALDGISNGNRGDIYASLGAQCACPNVNEKNSAIDGTSVSGSVCKSALDFTDVQTKKYALLTTFIPSVHQTGPYPQVLNPSVEPVSSDASGNIVSTLKLSTFNGGYQQYRRRIWTCAPPLVLKPNGTCAKDPTLHACSDGGASGLASVVANHLGTAMSETDAKIAFNHAANKKLACCLNDFDPNNPKRPEKFDCIDNSQTPYADFNALWTDKDADADGGQARALVLVDGSGHLQSGFYTLDGNRCNEFSEFGGAIQSAKINPIIVSGQQTKIGNGGANEMQLDSSTITSPPASIGDWFATHNIKTPVSVNVAAMRRCPVLVRAAMQVACPAVQVLPKLSPTYKESSGITRCTAAASIQIHLRVEQIYEIAGSAKMKTVDTVLDPTQVSTVDVGSFIQAKTRGHCPAGSIVTADAGCSFQ